MAIPSNYSHVDKFQMRFETLFIQLSLPSDIFLP